MRWRLGLREGTYFEKTWIYFITLKPSLMTFENYLKKLGVEENLFFGQFIQEIGKSYGFFRNIISKDGKLLLNLESGRRESVGINSHFIERNNLEPYYFYSFKLKFAPLNLQERFGNNYYCSIAPGNPPVKKNNTNPFKDIISLRYKRLRIPDSNLIIANLLREIGKGMYSSKKRMIFELLQNADDVPVNGETKFFIETYKNYLLIAHNGLPFNEDDVKSITSAAESTKQKNQKKTGYKGIGFKSVFTDSSQVLIKSGGFLFEFNKNSPSYSNFDEFYFNRKRYIKYPELKEEDSKLWEDAKINFSGFRDIPWQILPIWKKEIPIALRQSNFSMDNNVGIALKIGQSKLESYSKEIKKLSISGRFILFLRHVNYFKFSNENLTIKKSSNDSGKIKIQVRANGIEKEYKYTLKDFDQIRVDNNIFMDNQIPLRKATENIETGEVTSFFEDLEGNRIDTIPPKIASFKTTTISFAAPIIKGQIQCEPTFKSYKDYSYLYTYLPMREYRIKLPFLVNADFVPSSNREEIQDNPWNTYIFSQIGKLCVDWIASLATIENPQYLSLLLPKELKSEESDVLPVIGKFNESYKEAIRTVPFIVDDKGERRKCEEIILDTTNLSLIFDSETFYNISGSLKSLPNQDINSEILLKDIFEIEKYNFSNLANDLTQGTSIETIGNSINNLNDEHYLKFLIWFNELLVNEETGNSLLEFTNSLKFIRFKTDEGVTHYSWNELKDSSNHMVINTKLSRISDQLLVLGFDTSHFIISGYPNIFKALKKDGSYLDRSNFSFLAEKISSKFEGNELDAKSKVKIYYFLLALDLPEVPRKNISLFKNTEGKLFPLSEMIGSTPTFYKKYLENHVIDSVEEAALEGLKDQLSQENELYNSFIVNDEYRKQLLDNLEIDKLGNFYEFVWNVQELCTEKEQNLNAIPILYTNTENGFKKLSDVYYYKELIAISDYSSVKNAIEKLTDYLLPNPKVLPFLKKWDVSGTAKLLIQNLIKGKINLSIEETTGTLTFLSQTQQNDKLFDFGYFYCDVQNELCFESSQTNRNFNLKENENHNLISKLLETDFTAYFPLPSNLRDISGLSNLGLIHTRQMTEMIVKESSNYLYFVSYLETCTPIQKKNWLGKDLNIELNSSQKYSEEDDEFRVLRMLIEFQDDEDLINSFREKITIDSKPLADIAIKDFVTAKFENVTYEFSLANLLPDEYSGKSNILELIINNFEGLSASKLNKLFGTQTKPNRIIFDNLIEQSDWSAEQFVFMHVYEALLAKKIEVKTEIKNELKGEVLEFCFQKASENIYPVLEKFIPKLDFIPSNFIFPEELSFGKDRLENWVLDWIGSVPEKNESKVQFLEAFGLNTKTSQIGYLRSIFVEKDIKIKDDVSEIIAKIGSLKSGWLSRTCEMIRDKNTELLANRIICYKSILASMVFQNDILLPVLTTNETGEEIEIFEIPFKENTLVYFGKDLKKIEQDYPDKDYHLQIRELILNKGDKILSSELDDKWISEEHVSRIEIAPEYDISALDKAQDVIDETYLNWEFKDKYPLKYLESNIPKLIKFGDVIIDNILGAELEKIGDIIYFNKKINFINAVIHYTSYEDQNSLIKSHNFSDPSKLKVLESENQKFRKKLISLGHDPDNIYKELAYPSSDDKEIVVGNSTPLKTDQNSTIVQSEEFDRSPIKEYDHIDKELQISISEETREMVKKHLDDLGYSTPNPFGPYSIIEGVITPEGAAIPIVVKSAMRSQIAIHPTEWIHLLKPDARLFLRLKGNIITTISLFEILSSNERFQLDFSVEHVSQELTAALAQVFQYVKDVKFVVQNPNAPNISLTKSFMPKEGEAGTANLF